MSGKIDAIDSKDNVCRNNQEWYAYNKANAIGNTPRRGYSIFSVFTTASNKIKEEPEKNFDTGAFMANNGFNTYT